MVDTQLRVKPRGTALLNAKLTFGAWLAWNQPAQAYAQARGGKLLVMLYALPMALPALGITVAILALRLSRAPLLWWFLCTLLGLNSAVLGSVLQHAQGGAGGVVFLMAQMGLAGTMLFTLPDSVREGRLRIVLRRLLTVVPCALLPGLLVALLAS